MPIGIYDRTEKRPHLKWLTKSFLTKEYLVNKKLLYEISKMIGCSCSTVFKYLKIYNISIRSKAESRLGEFIFSRLTKEFLIQEYLLNKRTPTEIGESLGCSNQSIFTALKKYNIPLRTLSESISGELCYNWQGGKSFEPYSIEFNSRLKEKIRTRDNFQCQNKECNMTEEEHLIVYGDCLSVHHVDYDKKNCDERNLISACCQCNARANFNREYWKNYYCEIIKMKIYIYATSFIS